MSRRRIAVCLAALVASVLVAVPSPAQAARTGELTVHFEGVFGEPLQLTPRLTVWQAVGKLRFAGVFEDLLPDGGATAENLLVDLSNLTNADSIDSLGIGTIAGPVVLVCVFGSTDSGSCRVFGGLRGAGTLTIDVLERRAGGRFVFHIHFPFVICPRCPAR